METMTASHILLCLMCLVVASMALGGLQASVHQEVSSFLSATVGNNITLPCLYEDNAKISAKLYWYKQSLGMKPTLISSFFKYDKKSTFYGEFNNSHRFQLDNQAGKNDLSITNVQISDSAVYLCVRCALHQLEILESFTVIVKDLNDGVQVLQSLHENTQPGRSVNLSCTVHTGTCDGLHSVYWFKKSEESGAGIIYTDGGSNGQCERNTDNQTNSCVYNLPILKVSSEDTGTYYCAVASCGQVLFGNGTMVNVKNGVDLAVCFLSGALALTSALVVLLVFSLFTMKKKYSSLSTELKCRGRFSTPATTNAEVQNQEGHDLNYAALSINHPSRRQRSTTKPECVYSGVRQDNST